MGAATVSGTAAADYATAFESMYVDARGDSSRLPWGQGVANPALVAWLNAIAPSVVRCGARVAVVGCGLGEDARELMSRGYEVTAFDVSPTAVKWARSLDPANDECYHVVDLFDLPARWRRRFDLAVEVDTFQSIHPSTWTTAARAMVELMSPHGSLLVIAQGGESSAADQAGPPWPLTSGELLEVTTFAGLEPARPIDAFLDDEDPPKLRLRGVFNRP